jgi:hypothetical protein
MRHRAAPRRCSRSCARAADGRCRRSILRQSPEIRTSSPPAPPRHAAHTSGRRAPGPSCHLAGALQDRRVTGKQEDRVIDQPLLAIAQLVLEFGRRNATVELDAFVFPIEREVMRSLLDAECMFDEGLLFRQVENHDLLVIESGVDRPEQPKSRVHRYRIRGRTMRRARFTCPTARSRPRRSRARPLLRLRQALRHSYAVARPERPRPRWHRLRSRSAGHFRVR